MKKLFLFLVATAFAVTSCSDDDNKKSSTVDTTYLNGTWIETDPTPGKNTLTFTGTTARLDRADGSSENYSYSVTDNELKLTLPGNQGYSLHEATRVNSKTMKLGNFYIQTANANSVPIVATFKKAQATNF